MPYKAALVGNPNSGKTSLFNDLTGSNQYVGNWPGVTVEKKSGFTAGKEFEVVDLPGIYSLSPYTMEEIVTRDFIIDQHPDVRVNIVDGTNIERNLYLTLQVLELSIPTVVAVNMIDQVRGGGGDIDCDRLSAQLGVPVIPISAKTGYHVDKVMKTAKKLAGTNWRAEDVVRYDSASRQMLHEIVSILADYCDDSDRLLFYAGKLVEQDENILRRLKLPEEAIQAVDRIVALFLSKAEYGDRETVMADIRYRYIEKLVAGSVKKPENSGALSTTDKIDKVLTNRFLAIPIFFLIIFLMFGRDFFAGLCRLPLQRHFSPGSFAPAFNCERPGLDAQSLGRRGHRRGRWNSHFRSPDYPAFYVPLLFGGQRVYGPCRLYYG